MYQYSYIIKFGYIYIYIHYSVPHAFTQRNTEVRRPVTVNWSIITAIVRSILGPFRAQLIPTGPIWAIPSPYYYHILRLISLPHSEVTRVIHSMVTRVTHSEVTKVTMHILRSLRLLPSEVTRVTTF